MKYIVALLSLLVAAVSGFAPMATPFFNKVFDMDLFAPKSDQNMYGARKKKNLKVGKLGSKAYVPNGLSRAEYEKIRAGEQAKKDANYAKNVKKAGKFQDFTVWYINRGTDKQDGWKKSVTLGHTMAKTKFDWSGKKDENKKYDGLAKK
eukprot:CAMPEP_0118684708 /NCGR_PEP_ID=MMETSP0800-20121206/6807_1 /TAXON_ID=210618 ORGANISM="Striatella unipunctata, Strain CCMP2910" /NCGR_SAMPLE_ID=MMETSP0800 /ASSEMBLY_ACC=CAM_ASM_000638 /LENGTH=148 /DNA_ID=CAMNT_0006581471 /DNA_START=57 /DNA_END=503 /DNA_ORIENTATION=-